MMGAIIVTAVKTSSPSMAKLNGQLHAPTIEGEKLQVFTNDCTIPT
jgi:hypothetical protein